MRWQVRFRAKAAFATAVACGCGGGVVAAVSPDASTGPSESTPDGAAEGGLEASSVSCVVDGASLGAFEADLDGSDAASLCITCIVQTCSAQLQACAVDCTCNSQLLAFLACSADGGSAVTCGEPLAMADAATVQALADCVGGFLAGGTGVGCLLQCGVGRTGSDAGVPGDAGAFQDASAPADAAPTPDGAIAAADAPVSD